MIHVVGGTYNEICHFPAWHQLFGSGGRAAAALAALSDQVVLSTFSSKDGLAGRQALADCFGFGLGCVVEADDVTFEYLHPLKCSAVWPPTPAGAGPAIKVAAPIVLRYGCWEGEAVVDADIAVYDPQSPSNPVRFDANGSRAKRLAIVCNRGEGELLTGQRDQGAIINALLHEHGAEAVVLKVGPTGAIAASRDGASYTIPAYRTDHLFPIGSGDVYSAVFAHYWAEDSKPLNIAADLASKATAWYCATSTFPNGQAWETSSPITWCPVCSAAPGRVPRVYLAGPFFSAQQLWFVEELRAELTAMGIDVFSPYHDVGCFSSATDIATKDLDGLRSCDVVLAILDGLDPGTIFEVGYARSINIPVVGLLQQQGAEDFKMFDGTDVRVERDAASAVYKTVWTAIEKAM